MMKLLGLIQSAGAGAEKLRNARGVIVRQTTPSLIDVVILMPTCRSRLHHKVETTKQPLRTRVVRGIYISNSLDSRTPSKHALTPCRGQQPRHLP